MSASTYRSKQVSQVARGSRGKSIEVILLAVVLALALSSVCYLLELQIQPGSQDGQTYLKKFTSYEELKSYLESNLKLYSGYRGSGLWSNVGFSLTKASADVATLQAFEVVEYSKTNVQVEGVDEADVVKTDGVYIYLASGNRVVIVKAYPPRRSRCVVYHRGQRYGPGVVRERGSDGCFHSSR
ncbi:beta-propeller domain-containing protein [Candidatus Bathyarchaeota archaeon]|nr:beta-propeller domain-containing protein [Candidatus Bathyarchaeota archaeon]